MKRQLKTMNSKGLPCDKVMNTEEIIHKMISPGRVKSLSISK